MADETYDPTKDKDRAKKIAMGQDAPKAPAPKAEARKAAEPEAEPAKEETDGEKA